MGHQSTDRLRTRRGRSFSLPDGIDRDKISADFAKGLLTLTLPKTAEAQKQQKKIEVKAG